MSRRRDTVSQHLADAIAETTNAAKWKILANQLRADAAQYAFVPGRRAELDARVTRAEEGVAFSMGLAAGHAFRAAELAYDAGRRDGAHCAARASHDVPVRHAVDAAERQMQIDFAAEWHAQIATLHRGLAEAHVDLTTRDAVFPEREDDGS